MNEAERKRLVAVLNALTELVYANREDIYNLQGRNAEELKQLEASQDVLLDMIDGFTV